LLAGKSSFFRTKSASTSLSSSENSSNNQSEVINKNDSKVFKKNHDKSNKNISFSNQFDPIKNNISILDLSKIKIYDGDFKLISGLPDFQNIFINSLDLSEKNIIHFFKAQSLKKIDFSYNHEFDDQILPFLKYSPYLDSISLKETNITNKSLYYLKDLYRLKNLDISYTDISNSGLQYLSNLNLVELNIESNRKIDEMGLFYLSNSTSDDSKNLLKLKKINLSKTKISGIGLKYLKKMKNLEELNLEETSIDDSAIKHLLQFKKIKSLNLAYTNISDNSLYKIRLFSLEKLNLSNNPAISSQSISYLNELPLSSLSLAGTNIDDEGIDYFLSLNQIKHLDVSDTLITDDGVLKLSRFVSLESLNLSKNKKITAKSLNHLKSLKNISCLNLKQNSINYGLKHLSSLYNLKILNLSYSQITDKSFENFYSPSLETMDVSWNTKITDKVLAHFKLMPSLKTLNLRGTNISKNALDEFIKEREDVEVFFY